MAPSPSRPAPLVNRVFRGADAIRAGLLTKDDLRGPAWRRLFRGVYADATLPVSYRQRCFAAAWYLLPKGAALAGRSAAWLYGVNLAWDEDPVEVLVPRESRFGPVAGLRIHIGDLSPDEVREVDGIRRTSPLRTAWDLALWLELPDAVAYLDLMVARRLVTTAGLVRYARERAGRRGWRRLLKAATLVDPAAESVQESRLRVKLALAGLPKPVSQHVIEHPDGSISRVDLAWPELRVAVEYDGRHHAEVTQMHVDRARLNRLVTTDGWVILHITSRRLQDDFDGFVAEVRIALRQQRGRLDQRAGSRDAAGSRGRTGM